MIMYRSSIALRGEPQGARCLHEEVAQGGGSSSRNYRIQGLAERDSERLESSRPKPTLAGCLHCYRHHGQQGLSPVRLFPGQD